MDDFSIPNVSNYFGLAPFPSNYIAVRRLNIYDVIPFNICNCVITAW